MKYNKVIITALIGAIALGLYFSKNRLEAQVKLCSVSAHDLDSILQTIGDSDIALSNLDGSIELFQQNIMTQESSVADSAYLIDDAKASSKEVVSNFEVLKRQLEAEITKCAPHKK